MIHLIKIMHNYKLFNLNNMYLYKNEKTITFSFDIFRKIKI